MKIKRKRNESGFSVIELLISTTIALVLLGLASVILGKALGTRSRESRRTDALTSAQSALNVMSREIGNSGYGISDSTNTIHENGIVIADSNSQQLRIRANIDNTNSAVTDLGEDVIYYFDNTTKSIIRYDPAQTPATSYVVNRISNVNFQYFNYTGSSSTPTVTSSPSVDTSRVRITISVQLDPVQGQPNNQTVVLTSDVTLRNSNYMMNQY